MAYARAFKAFFRSMPLLYGFTLKKSFRRTGMGPRTLGRLDADAREELRVGQRQLDHLTQLTDLVVQA